MKTRSKSSLFLLELMLVLLIFAICAVVCMMVFVKAAAYTMESRDINNAETLSVNMAESVKCGGITDDSVIFYDEHLDITDEKNGCYKASLILTESKNNIHFFEVEIVKVVTGKVIRRLDTAYIGG